MTTEQIKTPYDFKADFGEDDQEAFVCRVKQGAYREGYRRGVADTEAKYAELVEVAADLAFLGDVPFETTPSMEWRRKERMKAILAKVNGEA